MSSLEGRVVIVTGGGGGIGAGVCRRLARSGAQVAVVDVDGSAASRVAEEIGGDAHPIEADVSAEAASLGTSSKRSPGSGGSTIIT